MKKLSDEELAKLTPELREQYESMIETFGDPEEPLDPELEPWCVESDSFGTALKHPLVYSIPLMPGTYAMMNKALRAKREMLERYASEKNWHGWINAYERPYRLYAFSLIETEIEDDATYWDVLGAIWTDSENIWENEDDWGEYLSAERADREHLMEEDERMALDKLPDTIEIHRGYKLKERKLGMSWTVNKPQAEWFARRLIREGERAYVVSGTVPKDKVLAYFLGRGESEIVAFPEDITVTKTTRVSAMPKSRNPAETGTHPLMETEEANA